MKDLYDMGMFSAQTLSTIAIARLLLFAGVGIMLMMALKKKGAPLSLWAVAIGFIFASGVGAILLPGRTLLWGNQGDEAFQIAFLSRVIDGDVFSDFFYRDLSLFYPPLFFWIFGTLGRIARWNGIQAAQWGAILTYAFLPLFSLWFVKACAWTKKQQFVALSIASIALLVLPTDALMLKPYEVVAALLSVLWIISFAELLKHPSQKLRVLLGLGGGIIFLLYYFWFMLLIPAMLGLIFSNTFLSKNRWTTFYTDIKSFTVIGCLTTLIALPFLLPYVTNLIELGQENYQATYFFPTDAYLSAPWLSFSLLGVLAMLSLLTYIIRRPWTSTQQAMIAIGGSILLWHMAQLWLTVFGEKPIMLSKAFLFLGGIALVAPALESIADLLREKNVLALLELHRIEARHLLAGTVIILFPLFPGGLFIDKIHEQLEKNTHARTSEFVAENILASVPDYKNRMWLVSGLQDLNGILPLSHYLAWNPQFSHPSALWGSRLTRVEQIASLSTTRNATRAFDALNIDALLFFKAMNEDGERYYPFFYEADTWPNGTQSQEIRFSPNLISENDWEIRHEDNDWIIFTRKSH